MDDVAFALLLRNKLGPVRCSFDHHSKVVEELFPHQVDVPYVRGPGSWDAVFETITEHIGQPLCSTDIECKCYDHDAQWDWLFDLEPTYPISYFLPIRFRHVNHAIMIKMLLG